jgi:inorganic pyrophosphatase
MKYSAIIEIPKGSNRRIHMSYDNTGFIDLGPIKDHIPVNDGVMPICYGYLENIINKTEGDNVDTIIFSTKQHNTGDSIEVKIIGILTRKDGDHKIITTDDSVTIIDFDSIESKEKNLILKYFGYKSEIISIGSKEEAIEYLKSCMN